MALKAKVILLLLAAVEALATGKSRSTSEEVSVSSSYSPLSDASSSSWSAGEKAVASASKGGRPRKKNPKGQAEAQRQLRRRKKLLGISRNTKFAKKDRLREGKLAAADVAAAARDADEDGSNLSKSQKFSARKRMLGLRWNQKTPEDLQLMPFRVLVRAEQDRLRDPSLSIRKSVFHQKALYDQEHGIIDHHGSRASSGSPSSSSLDAESSAVDPQDAELLLGLSNAEAKEGDSKEHPRRDRRRARRY